MIPPLMHRTWPPEAQADLEHIIGYGDAGCVAPFEIDDARTVSIVAIRHQREDDYH